LDLRKQILRDIDGAGFARLFAGQVMSGVAFALLTMAARAAAASVNQDEASGQDGRFRMKLFEPSEEMAADESGMLRNFHVESEVGRSILLSDM
jgi:hypothetical protein